MDHTDRAELVNFLVGLVALAGCLGLAALLLAGCGSPTAGGYAPGPTSPETTYDGTRTRTYHTPGGDQVDATAGTLVAAEDWIEVRPGCRVPTLGGTELLAAVCIDGDRIDAYDVGGYLSRDRATGRVVMSVRGTARQLGVETRFDEAFVGLPR